GRGANKRARQAPVRPPITKERTSEPWLLRIETPRLELPQRPLALQGPDHAPFDTLIRRMTPVASRAPRPPRGGFLHSSDPRTPPGNGAGPANDTSAREFASGVLLAPAVANEIGARRPPRSAVAGPLVRRDSRHPLPPRGARSPAAGPGRSRELVEALEPAAPHRPPAPLRAARGRRRPSRLLRRPRASRLRVLPALRASHHGPRVRRAG